MVFDFHFWKMFLDLMNIFPLAVVNYTTTLPKLDVLSAMSTIIHRFWMIKDDICGGCSVVGVLWAANVPQKIKAQWESLRM